MSDAHQRVELDDGSGANPPTAPLGSAANPMNIAGTFSASLGTYAPGGTYATLSCSTATGARVALPAGTTVVVYNTGANAAYVKLGNTSVQAGTTNDVIQPGSWMAFVVGANVDLSAITASGSTTLNISGGAGLPAGAGGGSGGGGGGGGAVTQSTGNSGTPWWVNLGTTDTANLATIATNSGNALPAGTNYVGQVGLTSLAGVNLSIPANWGAALTAAAGAYAGVNAAITNWGGTNLGAPSNYGTSPGAVVVPGVNAFVTNGLSVTTWGSASLGAATAVGTAGSGNVQTVNSYNVTPLPSTIISGQQATTTGAVALPSQALTTGVVLKAKSTNAATVYVGPSGVTTGNGYPLLPGDTVSYSVANLNALYIIGANTTDGVAWTGN